MKRIITLIISIITTISLLAIDPAGSRVNSVASSMSAGESLILIILFIFVGIPVGILLIASRKKDDK